MVHNLSIDKQFGRLSEWILPEYDKDAVRSFLRRFKALMREKEYYVAGREKNYQALIGLGITKKIREDELKSLTVLHYVSGPDPDVSYPGTVWIFGKMIRGREVYIKLKMREAEFGDMAICISFHESAEPLLFPFQPADEDPQEPS